MITGILIFFHVIACFTLILVILLQVGRGHGLSGASFAQSGVQTVFGTKTADFLSKATSVMAIVFMVTCISLDIIHSRRSRSLFSSSRAASKVDLEKIKQALEKLKAEQDKKGLESKEGTVPQPAAGQAVPNAAAVPTPVPAAAQTAKQPAASETPASQATAPTAPQPAAPEPATSKTPSKGG